MFFLLILITIGITLFFRHFYEELLINQGSLYVKDTSGLNEASRKMDEILSQKSKIIIFLFVPLAALNSFILFRKKKLNLSEHFIIGGMVLLGILLLSLFGNLLFYLDLVVDLGPDTRSTLSWIITIMTFLYIAYAYINAFGSDYKIWSIGFRILLFFIMILTEIFILFIVTFGVLTNWEFGDFYLNIN